jgi:hypothetical protein
MLTGGIAAVEREALWNACAEVVSVGAMCGSPAVDVAWALAIAMHYSHGDRHEYARTLIQLYEALAELAVLDARYRGKKMRDGTEEECRSSFVGSFARPVGEAMRLVGAELALIQPPPGPDRTADSRLESHKGNVRHLRLAKHTEPEE